MSVAGFAVSIVCCQHPSCTARAEGLPDGGDTYKGLPAGWIEVKVHKYRKTSEDSISSPFGDVLTRHYCSASHLPSELLPEDS